MERIISSDYRTIEDLVEKSDKFSLDEVRDYLDHTLEMWRENKITLAAMNAVFKFAYMYLERPDIRIATKNQKLIPIGYYSSFKHLSALFLYLYLKSLGFSVKLFPLNTTDKHLKEYIEKNKPTIIIFTLWQFIDLEDLKKLIPYLHKKNLKIYIGGIPFVYNKNLKLDFPDCIFPEDIDELVLLLNNSLKLKKDE
jgi:ABC-type molybdate transport system substrate-binding protein